MLASRCKRYPRKLLLSILDAMFTVSPNRQYLGMVIPTTPATTGPEEGTTEGSNCLHSPRLGSTQAIKHTEEIESTSIYLSVLGAMLDNLHCRVLVKHLQDTHVEP